MTESVAEAVARLTMEFTAAGIESARRDARILVGRVLNLEPSLLFARAGMEIAEPEMTSLRAMAARRLAHEPVSRILGEREFYGLTFKVTPDTLDPRPDTETLVDAVLAEKKRVAAPRILDLGTGTGCILLAVLNMWPEAAGLGIDINPGAVAVAVENARRLDLSARAAFQPGTWAEGLSGPFEIVVSNPPYVTDVEFPGLAPDVRLYDPRAALTAGCDGLDAYRALIAPASKLLTPEGRIFLEIGAGQRPAVTELAAAAGLRIHACHADLAGIDRCLVLGV
ncbi:MAG: peptide chain release factor N(5)-glutamine methyltransferase [Rhodospirillaceae bacterium]